MPREPIDANHASRLALAAHIRDLIDMRDRFIAWRDETNEQIAKVEALISNAQAKIDTLLANVSD